MEKLDLNTIKAAHKVISTYNYDLQPVVRGYANRTLYINLEDNKIESRPVTQQMKDVFTGGRGFCLWLLWNGVKDTTKWNDPENEFVLSCGVIGGVTAFPGTGKSIVATISPLTHSVIDSNGGGYFGPYLKFAGWDALEIQGKAENDVIIFIDGDTGIVQIEEAPLEEIDTHIISRQLTEMYGGDNLRSVSVVSAGQAADHVPMCGVNLSYYDTKRDEVRIKQAARGGAGSVLRDKKVKAVVVKFSDIGPDNNGVADMSLVRKAGLRINREITQFDASQNDMRGMGTPYLVDIMNRFELLPVKNFQYSQDERSEEIIGGLWKDRYDRRGPDGCWYGCTMQCAHGITGFTLKTGPYAGQTVMVDGPEYETLGALGSNCGIFDPEAILELNFYCDTYGIDTISAGGSISFVMECYERGLINKEITGGLELNFGNSDAALEILHQMARGEGFGVVVGQGSRALKHIFAERYGLDYDFLNQIGMESKGMEISEYITKEAVAQQAGYGLSSKGAQHDESLLVMQDKVKNQMPTLEQKAKALSYYPILRTWFSLHGMCKLIWNDITPESNKTAADPNEFPEHIENYTWLYEGVTGVKATKEDFIAQSARVYHFQRVFNLRLGFGTRKYDYMPYRAVGPVSEEEYLSKESFYDNELKEKWGMDPGIMSLKERIKTLRVKREDQYNRLVDLVYEYRGWTNNGIPTIETLKKHGIDFPDVVEVVSKHL